MSRPPNPAYNISATLVIQLRLDGDPGTPLAVIEAGIYSESCNTLTHNLRNVSADVIECWGRDHEEARGDVLNRLRERAKYSPHWKELLTMVEATL